MIKLGSKIKDRISTLEGIAISRIEYMNGCVRYGLQPQFVKDGKAADSVWVDEEQLEVLVEGIVSGLVTTSAPGGPGRPVPDTAERPSLIEPSHQRPPFV